MSTCCWCTPGGVSTVDFLKRYASKTLSSDFQTADEDLCYCLECVAEYHRARDELPFLHEVLWELETSRLINHFEKSMKAEIGEDDELYIVDDSGEAQLSDFTGQDFENKLRVPLLEILKYPYLLLHAHVNELCVEALCRMEQANCSFQVFDKHPGIYLFLVHPNEMVRRWAILTARNLGKVDRDDYYDLQEVLTCLFKVIELGLLESPDIYTSSVLEKGKLILLPSHMYDTTNYKNYWLGICMLLTILEEQAMDSLLLGADKQNDFMRSILHTMEGQSDDDSVDPFWPALHCFMVILDRLGSKVWGQLIDPIEAFQTIINSESYRREIQNVRNSSARTKLEPESYLDDMVTCSQIVYNYNPEKTKKDAGWRSAICPDYCPNMYEEMETLASVLQSDIGQDMRVHNSTFLWFIPFVQSLMDLKDLGVAYIVEVIHHLYSEVKDVLNQTDAVCDKVTEFFLLILVSVIELHRNKKCLHLLWVSSQQWVEAVVKCAKLPTAAFARSSEKSSGSGCKGAAVVSSLALHSMPSNSVQLACVQLIRSLLREGYQLGQQAHCKRFWDKLNLFLRGNLSLGWQLTSQETHELQTCLKQIIRNIKSKVPPCSTFVDLTPACKIPPVSYKEESDPAEKKPRHDTHCLENCSPAFSRDSVKAGAHQLQEKALVQAEEEDAEQGCVTGWKPGGNVSAAACSEQSREGRLAGRAREESGAGAGQQPSVRESASRSLQSRPASSGSETGCDGGLTSACALTDCSSSSLGKVSSSNEEVSLKDDLGKTSKPKTKAHREEICARLSRVIRKQYRKTTCVPDAGRLEENPAVSHPESCCPRKEVGVQKGNGFIHSLSLDANAVLDHNGELKKKLKTEEVDIFSSHKSSCKRQEGGVDGEDLVPCAEMNSASVRETCALGGSVTVLDSRDKAANKSVGLLSCDVARGEAPGLSPRSDTLTDSQVDRDLHRLSLMAQASVIKFPSDSVQKNSFQLQRKAKDDNKRHSKANQDNAEDLSCGQVIVISDSDDEEERILGFEKHKKQNKKCLGKVRPGQRASVVNTNVEKKLMDEEMVSLLEAEDSESQLFEFESSSEVYSAWQDGKPEPKSPGNVPSPSPRGNVPSPSPHGNVPSPSPRGNVPSPSPRGNVPSPSPHGNVPSPSPRGNVPSPSPRGNVPSPSPHGNVPSPSPRGNVPSPSPRGNVPSPSPRGKASPTPVTDITPDWYFDRKTSEPDANTKEVAKGAEERAEPQSSSTCEELCEGEVRPKRKRLEKPGAEEPARPSSSVSSEDRPENQREPSGSADERSVAPDSSADRAAAVSPRKSPKLRTYSKPIRRVLPSITSKKTPSSARRGQNKSLNYLSCRTTPAIVPPKKFRQCPEPTSTVEKLGLKKAPRKAFDLSQRSLDYLVQLRDHGKTVGVVDTRKRSKLISPQTLSVRNNKKLLISQDAQLRRQLRPRSRQNAHRLFDCQTVAAASAEPRTAQASASVPESGRSDCKKGGMEVLADSHGKQLIKCVPPEPETMKANSISRVAGDAGLLNQSESVALDGRTPTDLITSTSEDPFPWGGGGSAARPAEGAALTEAGPESGSDTDDESLFLTQNDPEDMDLCSQMETYNDELIEVGHGKVADGALSWPQSECLRDTKCKDQDCVEAMKSAGDYCASHSEAEVADEAVFRKPGLPPSAAKPLRPSTTKVFSSSSTSRIANFSRSLENASALTSALKNKSSGTQSVLKGPQPVPLVLPEPVGEGKGLCSVLPQPPANPSRQRHTLPFGESKSLFSASSPVNTPLSAQSLSDTFVKEVLTWKYDMFLNFDQCGPPASLCQSISRPVPVRFQDCGDYFNVFFPLVMLNTFETVAQEWMNSPNKENFYQLHLRKFPADYKKYWEFVVYLEECELAKQLHPKENDLVFLVPERLNGEKRDAERNRVQDLSEYHCGYVHKFRRTSVMRGGKAECSLSIQTQENLPANLNDLVRCVVISSLVTTQRKLKAMSLLSGGNQLARAVLNPEPMNFCAKDGLTTSSERIFAHLRDFNEDQKKAIETAYSMVKHSPSVAKICLIHGPPGTGKSKTIVGLLYCLLTENQKKGHSGENFNAKIKQNRVLVCAPSNAAVDELMKKIILEFKEKCKDKKNPLGNCGDINLVRLGPEKSINNEVLRFSLDSQVNHRMKKDLPSHVQEMHRRKEILDRQLDELSRQRALCRGGREMQRQELDREIVSISKERQELASKIKEVQGRPQKTQNIIILESHVICCTLSTSGGLLLESAFRGQGGVPFSCVIVDEAGQSCEVETLTPLIHRCNKLILVGDPKQLPPTVISMKAQEYGYDQSMMARFCKLLEEAVERSRVGRLPVLQLTVQYRMHPDICLFPSNYVYNRSLRTNRLTETNRCSSDWPFQPYLVFDVGDGSERRDNDSYVNIQEIKLVMEIIKLIKDKRRDITFRNVGIITHYKAQKTMIQKDLDKEFDRRGPAEVDTVDAFQGRQKDCVIVTCVRANALQGSIGFLASLQRMNVTITRAKYSLFILGHLRTLMENQHWNQLIQDAQKRGAIVKTCDKSYRHDALKILKLKPVLQRHPAHPPTTVPEVARPQGGLPSNRLDGGLAWTSFASSLCHALSDVKEDAVASTVPERQAVQDPPRDPRLLKRMRADAQGGVLREPRPPSPQHPGCTPPAGEPGCPGAPQDACGAGQQAAARLATLSAQQPPGQGEPLAAGPDAAVSKRRWEARALSEGGQGRCYAWRDSGWDAWRAEGDSSSKQQQLWQ